MDSETILVNTVGSVRSKFTEFGVLWTNINVSAWTNSMLLHVVPVAVSISASNSVVNHSVVGMGNPEATGGLISGQQTIGSFCSNGQIVIVDILCLSSIFNEEGMTHGVIGDVVEHSEVVNSMSGHSTVVGLVDSVTTHVRLVHSSNHMVMEGVATKLEGLTNILEFDVLDSSNT